MLHATIASLVMIAASLDATIELDGRAVTLELAAHPVRSDDYAVYRSTSDGRLERIETEPALTFRGVVRGDPGSRVAVSMLDGAPYGRLELGNGDVFTVAGGDVRRAEPAPSGPVPSDRVPSDPPLVAELAVEADFQFQGLHGRDTVFRIESIVNQMNVQYERDVGITHEITTIILQAHQLYDAHDPEVMLEQMRDRWIEDLQDVERDVAHLFSGRITGGAAFQASICDEPVEGEGYGVVGDQVLFPCATDQSAHVLGHNWSAVHCNCPGFTMHASLTCANRFSAATIARIVAFRDALDCLRPPCPVDLDRSGAIDFGDILVVLDAWATKGGPADLDGNGFVGFGDLLVVLDAWGPCP